MYIVPHSLIFFPNPWFSFSPKCTILSLIPHMIFFPTALLLKVWKMRIFFYDLPFFYVILSSTPLILTFPLQNMMFFLNRFDKAPILIKFPLLHGNLIHPYIFFVHFFFNSSSITDMQLANYKKETNCRSGTNRQ